MNIDSLALRDFRNWQEKCVCFGPEVNIIWGPNGRGKTNLLEAVFLFSGVKSWRAGKKSELIRWDSQRAILRAGIHNRGRSFDMVMQLPTAGKSSILVNQVKMEAQSRLSDYFRCILFSPEDLHLVKGPPAQRRSLLDTALRQLRPRYAELLDRYDKLLQSKARLLKAEHGSEQIGAMIPEYNMQLAATGAALIRYRALFTQLLDEQSRKYHSLISGGREALRLSYQTVSTVVDPTAGENVIAGQLLEHLYNHREAEERMRMCLSGVHRDDLEITINDRSARAYGSQGQTRSAALSLKFGERELFFQDSGEYPVLLLDDVFSELDQTRRRFICQHAIGGQSILTGCEAPEEFSGANILEV